MGPFLVQSLATPPPPNTPVKHSPGTSLYPPPLPPPPTPPSSTALGPAFTPPPCPPPQHPRQAQPWDQPLPPPPCPPPQHPRQAQPWDQPLPPPGGAVLHPIPVDKALSACRAVFGVVGAAPPAPPPLSACGPRVDGGGKPVPWHAPWHTRAAATPPLSQGSCPLLPPPPGPLPRGSPAGPLGTPLRPRPRGLGIACPPAAPGRPRAECRGRPVLNGSTWAAHPPEGGPHPGHGSVATVTGTGGGGGAGGQRPNQKSLWTEHRPQISGPFDKILFFPRENFLMWVGGGAGSPPGADQP